MARTLALVTLVTFGVASSYAGQIMLGSGVNGQKGLDSQSGVTISGGTGASLGTYAASSFQGVGSTGVGTNGTVLCAGTTPQSCTPQQATAVPRGEPNNEFATANGVTFAMINDTQACVGGCNVWAASTAGGGANTNTTITIPVGVFGVTNVYTMLNDEYGLLATGSNTPTSVQFNFVDQQNNQSNILFTLVNGTVIRDGFGCTDALPGWTALCPSQYATTLSDGRFDTSGNATAYSAALASVTAFNVWSGTYTQGTGAYLHNTGNLYLDAQNFYLGSAAASLTLQSIVIKDTPGLITKSSRDLLTAVTLQTAASETQASATPEPGTVLLGLAGLSMIVFSRRKKN